MAKITVTFAWPAVPNAASYDLYVNGVKKSSTTNLSARFSVAAGDKVEAKAVLAPPPTTSGPLLGMYLWGFPSMDSGLTWAQRRANAESWLGRKLDLALEFGESDTWDDLVPGWITGPIAANPTIGCVYGLPLLVNGASYAQAQQGAYDSMYRTAAQRLATVPNLRYIRLGWEMNIQIGPWYAAQDPAGFVATWRRAVPILRASLPNVPIIWNPTAGYGQVLAETVYPGDDVVDLIALDNYDQAWGPGGSIITDPVARWNQLLNQADGLTWLDGFAKQHGKPMAFPEWGVAHRSDGHGGDDDPLFIQNMHDWIAARADRVAFHSYWMVQADDVQSQLMAAGYPPSGDSTQFPQSAAKFRTLFKT